MCFTCTRIYRRDLRQYTRTFVLRVPIILVLSVRDLRVITENSILGVNITWNGTLTFIIAQLEAHELSIIAQLAVQSDGTRRSRVPSQYSGTFSTTNSSP